MNTQKTLLDQKVASYNLLNHPFYQAWSNGTLPVESLKLYAREYGAFIGTLNEGWNTAGEPLAAEEEVRHAKLWDKFASALNTTVTNTPETTEVQNLVSTAKKLFSNKVTTLGALYAFEVQQPLTAQSKLEGLKTHYTNLNDNVKPYFETHAKETIEAEMLLTKMASLTEGDKLLAVNACEEMSKALWDALSGIHKEECTSCTTPTN